MLSTADGPLLTVFAAVMRCGSFSGAATALRLSKSAVSDRIKELERRCGVRLIERTTRSLRVTEAGAEVLAVAEKMEAELIEVSRTLEIRRRAPTGVVRVATTTDLGPLLVAPTAARFVSRYPDTRVEILCEDSQRDVIVDHVDLAVRLGAMVPSSLVGTRLAILRELIVASPALAAQVAAATRPSDLLGLPWVRHALVAGTSLRFVDPTGAHEEVSPDFRAEANTGATVVALLLHGAGIGVMPEHVLREHLASGRLVQLCPGWIRRQITLHALTASRASQRPALTVFVQLLRAHLEHDAASFGMDAAPAS